MHNPVILDNMAYAFTNLAGLCCVIICDQEYPQRVALALINKILDEFTQTIPRERWQAMSGAGSGKASSTSANIIPFPSLKAHLAKYQDPHEADPILRVQRELDETKVVLHKTMSSLMERGEKLEDLVAKSDELSTQSKLFLKTAKKTNSCCVVQ